MAIDCLKWTIVWKFPISSQRIFDKTIVDGAYREFHYAYGHFVTAGSKLVGLKENLMRRNSFQFFLFISFVCFLLAGPADLVDDVTDLITTANVIHMEIDGLDS
ncbi:hypothetical protein IFM89_031039 [Coptis chinensis]|uniref:Uncharacterized protein n=1 Tax=Coptis chinensis TaxID=261450 RepID=A0A835HA08_9MAGN|nr:hypothetical protein IFM89_031039 [Coptis chinensis]